MITLEQWVAAHGSVIITSDSDHPIGHMLDGVQESSALITSYQTTIVTRTVMQKYRVVRRATKEEFLTQMQLADPTVEIDEFATHEYFFEVKPIVN